MHAIAGLGQLHQRFHLLPANFASCDQLLKLFSHIRLFKNREPLATHPGANHTSPAGVINPVPVKPSSTESAHSPVASELRQLPSDSNMQYHSGCRREKKTKDRTALEAKKDRITALSAWASSYSNLDSGCNFSNIPGSI